MQVRAKSRFIRVADSCGQPTTRAPYELFADLITALLKFPGFLRLWVCGQEVREAEFDIVHPDGQTVNLIAYAAPLLDEQGRPTGAHYLGVFVKEMKASGFVRDALDRSGQTGAAVAPVSP